MFLSPRKQKFSDILINSLGVFIAGIIGSIFIIIVTFIISDFLNIVSTFEVNKSGTQTTSMFPIIISLITLFGTSITSFFTYYILSTTDSEKYKRNIVIFGQLAFFQLLTYIFISPIYIYTGLMDYNNIILIFIFHTLIIIFGTNLLLEIFNNYRYILIGFYGTFIGLFISIIFTILIFNSLGDGTAKLIMLTLLLPIINFTTVFVRQLFETIYYSYYRYTSMDQLGDIFYQIELEEEEKARTEEEKNSI
ncbi:MAG: hypothetical protein PHV23_05455 [Candidatus Gracilibacteria bacterium]|nr:hypothetical protein [Candidatus Gracilibacteria bacterium]